jgi:hypothetical protein
MSGANHLAQPIQIPRTSPTPRGRKLHVGMLSLLVALLCVVIFDFAYCAHVRHRRSVRASIGYGTTPAEVLRLLGEPDLKSGGKWIYKYTEPRTMSADSMIARLLLEGAFEFTHCTFTVEFEGTGMGMNVSSEYRTD